MVPKPGRGGWLTQSLPVPEPAPTSLEQKGSECGLGVRCGWLSKLRNAFEIFIALSLDFPDSPKLSHIPTLSDPHLSPTANLTLDLFL